jgi:hypothetical protein
VFHGLDTVVAGDDLDYVQHVASDFSSGRVPQAVARALDWVAQRTLRMFPLSGRGGREEEAASFYFVAGWAFDIVAVYTNTGPANR